MIYCLKHIDGDRSDPQSLASKILRFFDWMEERGYSDRSRESYARSMLYFSRWCSERGLTRPQEINRSMLDRYCRFVNNMKRVKDNQPVSFGFKHNNLSVVCLLFRWLSRTRQILYNPATDIEFPRRPFCLPRQVLSVVEVEQVLNSIDMNTPMGLRNRAIMEVLYSTGIRRAEACELKMEHIDMEKGWIKIEQGKYNKDRMVPVGERALMWLEKYLNDIRPLLCWKNKIDYVFLSREGKKMACTNLTRIMADIINKAKISKTGACHIFRHTMATLMLEGGADIRYIQEMLGHEDLKTTQVYTKVSIGKLKEVHEKTHPGAFLNPGDHDIDSEKQVNQIGSESRDNELKGGE